MALFLLAQKNFSSTTVRRVLKQTVTADKLNQLNEKLLKKLNKRPDTDIAEYTNPTNEIQRERINPDFTTVQFKFNPERVGLRKDYDLSEVAAESQHAVVPHVDEYDRKRVATIYQPSSRACQDTPQIDWGKYWVVSWEPRQFYKSPLMHYGTATNDPFGKHEVKFNTLKSAINMCRDQGFGVDIIMPRHRFHSRQAYIDNFNWKGDPKKEEIDDD
ncbi:unnamed protein product [Moneuplotes crassus]|uniref:NADH dehydrogenase [ubiquinone] iron-sulfur protein 4, mitochondrial n=1 Tax=Euplotes crassus TaxID=5936 RepID=A0AAD2D5G7_EUPCR|nr:unnamed protein product [Moneuplotes crassus]